MVQIWCKYPKKPPEKKSANLHSEGEHYCCGRAGMSKGLGAGQCVPCVAGGFGGSVLTNQKNPLSAAPYASVFFWVVR